MEFIERPNLLKIHYLNSLNFNQFKEYSKTCKNDEERRIKYDMLKSFCQTNIKTRCETKRIYSYTVKTPLTVGGRLYCGNSIQGIPKDFRGFLMSNTTDIDMKNCHPKILKYLCKLNNISCPNLSWYIDNRESILAGFGKDGKTAFLKAVNDDKLNLKIKDKFFKDFDKECKLIQKAIISIPEYADIVNTVPTTRTYNFDGSAINRILCVYENKIIQKLISILNKKQIEVAVLMFDGLMIYGDYYQDIELLDDITKLINEEFEGLDMEWSYKEHSNLIQLPENFVIPEEKIKGLNKCDLKFANNDLEASNIIYSEIKDTLIYSNNTFYFKQDNLWIHDFDNLKGSILKYVMNSGIYKTNDKGDVIDYVQNRKCADNVAKTVLDTAIEHKNDAWYSKIFSSSLGKILFNNGYYDFKASKFYNINDELFDKSIIFVENIYYDWETNFTDEECEYINQTREKLFYTPFGVDVGDYYILNLARGLAGDCMKRCLFGIGSSNTGKSIITSALKSTCGGYFGDFNAVNIAYKPNSSADEAQKLRWLMLLQSKRIICSNEIQMGIEIDGNMIKKISNGGLDAITARGHGGNETSFKVSFLPIIFANDIDKISPKDDAVINRIRAIHYEKVCVENPTNEFEMKMDINLSDEIETPLFRRAFMAIMFQAYHDFHTNNRIEIEPEGIQKAKTDIFGADVSIISLFKEDFEITDNEDDYVMSSDIEKWLADKKCKISMTKFGLELNKYVKLNKLENITNKVKKIKGKPKRCWFGIKMIKEIDDELDE